MQSATLDAVKTALALALLVATSAAHAADTSYQAVIDRVDLEAASIGGYRLRIYLSALSLQGQILDLSDAKSIRLYVGSHETKLPFAFGTYDATNGDTDIVVLVQAGADFADALPMIADAIDRELLGKLPDRVKIAISTFDDSARIPKFQSVKALRGKVALSSDQAATDPPLLDTIDRALAALRKPTTNSDGTEAPARPRRKILIIVGDGRDASGDTERVTKTGIRAGKAGVRIHTLAYSPLDLRRPLLVLGELSKRSLGTLRWPGQGRKPIAETWNDSFRQLATEINKQNVVTFFASADDNVAGKHLRIATAGRIEATTNDVVVPSAASCAGERCDVGYCANDICVVPQLRSKSRVILKWLLSIAGIVVGAMALLGFIGWRMSQRRDAPPSDALPRDARPGHTRSRVTAIPPNHPAQATGVLPTAGPIAALILLTGPRAGERISLHNGFTIGKHIGCNLVIEDGYTSSQHAQIAIDPAGNYMLSDRGSTNGTFVNGSQIREFRLTHGAEIKIGSIEMRFLER